MPDQAAEDQAREFAAAFRGFLDWVHSAAGRAKISALSSCAAKAHPRLPRQGARQLGRIATAGVSTRAACDCPGALDVVNAHLTLTLIIHRE